jgi:hypothetical protein
MTPKNKKGMTTNFFLHQCLSSLFLDPGSGMGKNQDPGSGINIPDPPHCTILVLFSKINDKRWYFRKFMATGSQFLGIDSSGGLSSTIKSIPLV